MATADEERKRRLAQALRDNLKRRKAQDRARRSPVSPATPAEPNDPDAPGAPADPEGPGGGARPT